jgi:hypothetical protein
VHEIVGGDAGGQDLHSNLAGLRLRTILFHYLENARPAMSCHNNAMTTFPFLCCDGYLFYPWLSLTKGAIGWAIRPWRGQTNRSSYGGFTHRNPRYAGLSCLSRGHTFPS